MAENINWTNITALINAVFFNYNLLTIIGNSNNYHFLCFLWAVMFLDCDNLFLEILSFFSFLASVKGFLPNSFYYIMGMSTAFFLDFLPHLATCVFKVESYPIPVCFLFLMPFSLANFCHFVSFFS